jgi:type IV pilus assembly protein PilP
MTFGLLLCLLACGEAVEEPKGVEQAPVEPKKKEEPVAIVDDGYYYNPAGKRDPFQDFVMRTSGEAPKDRPPLLRFNVDKFTLRGVVWGTSNLRAMLVDPDGLGHYVRIGDEVGRNYGKVTSIEESSVIVTEEYQTPDGQVVVKPVEVRLATREGKKR